MKSGPLTQRRVSVLDSPTGDLGWGYSEKKIPFLTYQMEIVGSMKKMYG
jgi:hypothetical protein